MFPSERPHMLLLMLLIEAIVAKRFFYFSDPETNGHSHAWLVE